MGCGASAPKEPKPYNPDVDSSESEYSDAEQCSKLSRWVDAMKSSGWCCLGEANLDAMRRTYWGLGKEKWRESVDAVHWPHGRFVFDLCLHKQNAGVPEIGYLSSMYDAWVVAELELGQRMDSGTWLRIHDAAMHHPGNSFLVGKFRNKLQGNLARVSRWFPGFMRGMSKAAVAEHNLMPKKVCSVVDYDTVQYKYERRMHPMKRKRMKHYFERYVMDYYMELYRIRSGCVTLGSETREDHVLRAIARFMQKIGRTEPSRDGNTRTLVVLCNKLLVENGFTPCIYAWPDANGLVTLQEWEGEMRAGMKAWLEVVRGLNAAEACPGVRPPREYFVCDTPAPTNQQNAYFDS